MANKKYEKVKLDGMFRDTDNLRNIPKGVFVIDNERIPVDNSKPEEESTDLAVSFAELFYRTKPITLNDIGYTDGIVGVIDNRFVGDNLLVSIHEALGNRVTIEEGDPSLFPNIPLPPHDYSAIGSIPAVTKTAKGLATPEMLEICNRFGNIKPEDLASVTKHYYPDKIWKTLNTTLGHPPFDGMTAHDAIHSEVFYNAERYRNDALCVAFKDGYSGNFSFDLVIHRKFYGKFLHDSTITTDITTDYEESNVDIIQLHITVEKSEHRIDNAHVEFVGQEYDNLKYVYVNNLGSNYCTEYGMPASELVKGYQSLYFNFCWSTHIVTNRNVGRPGPPDGRPYQPPIRMRFVTLDTEVFIGNIVHDISNPITADELFKGIEIQVRSGSGDEVANMMTCRLYYDPDFYPVPEYDRNKPIESVSNPGYRIHSILTGPNRCGIMTSDQLEYNAWDRIAAKVNGYPAMKYLPTIDGVKTAINLAIANLLTSSTASATYEPKIVRSDAIANGSSTDVATSQAVNALNYHLKQHCKTSTETRVAKAGDTMTGNLSLGKNKLLGVSGIEFAEYPNANYKGIGWPNSDFATTGKRSWLWVQDGKLMIDGDGNPAREVFRGVRDRATGNIGMAGLMTYPIDLNDPDTLNLDTAGIWSFDNGVCFGNSTDWTTVHFNNRSINKDFQWYKTHAFEFHDGSQSGHAGIICEWVTAVGGISARSLQLTADINAVNINASGSVDVKVGMLVRGVSRAKKFDIYTGNDYAELFQKPKDYATTYGDIIGLLDDTDKELYGLASKRSKVVVGVHTDEYGVLIGGSGECPENNETTLEERHVSTHIPVGLAGRVSVHFIGKAKKGMRVILSDIPGVGCEYVWWKHWFRRHQIIGTIVENDDNASIRRVRMVINK